MGMLELFVTGELHKRAALDRGESLEAATAASVAAVEKVQQAIKLADSERAARLQHAFPLPARVDRRFDTAFPAYRAGGPALPPELRGVEVHHGAAQRAAHVHGYAAVGCWS